MPMPMNTEDWMQMVANASRAGGVWLQDVSSRSGTLPVEIPSDGNYHVILVKVDAQSEIVHESEKGNSSGRVPFSAHVKIGSMRDEIRMPDDFDRTFESLDGDVNALFVGANS